MFLNTHSYYSLRYGTISPKELISLAISNNLKAFCITDVNSTTMSLDVFRLAKKANIRVVLGVDFRNKAEQKFIMLAKNNLGFKKINSYLSEFLHQTNFVVPDKAKTIINSYVIYPFHSYKNSQLESNEYLGVRIQDIGKLRLSKWKNKLDKLVILHTISFQNKKGFNTHRLLRAIDNNTLLSKLSKQEQGLETDVFIQELEIKKAFNEFPKIINNTQNILNSCHAEFDFSGGVPNNQKSYTNNEDLDYRLLNKLTFNGLSYRYENPTEKVFSRIKKELKIIKEKKFVSYFLINWKILKYARSKDYYYVGRGSGANSIVAYLLRITDVDPIELDLYFERFINLYRTNPPDFDLDFSWRDRDDITQFIFKRFKNTALISVYNTFKHRASVRELGKVFGLPKHEIDKLSANKFNYQKLDRLSQLVLIYSKYIQGFPNYLGIHAGGILISEKPIHQYVATFMPPKGFATTQFDMVIAEDIGLYKFDILSQRGLGKIKEAVEIIKYNQPEKGRELDIHDIKRFKEDKEIKNLLRTAKAIGCFYVESPAMRMLMTKLQVDTYLGLVAASSVIRPGVSQSGMMRTYIQRHRFPEKRKEAHPILYDIMPETYGVMVYQEDVIKVAHYFGELTLGEADMLRRGMSGKFRSRSEFEKVKQQFFDNCKKSGKADDLAAEIWRQIESFAGYAFAKGHSASYAVESYQSLFLKAYFPIEYMVATINNFGGFYRTEVYVHEARMHGAIINPPCINKSYNQTIVIGKGIFIGFMFLQSFESKTAKEIINERTNNGTFNSLDDFINRVSISLEQITTLIKIDAFRFTKRNKRELLWEAHMKINKISFNETKLSLFKTAPVNYNTPKLSSTKLEDAFDQIELLGYPICNPFDLLVDTFINPMRAEHLARLKGKVVTIDGYLITARKVKTSNNKVMYFGNFVDYEGYFVDTVNFPPVVDQYPFRGKGIYRITGKIVEEFDCISIETQSMERLAIVEDPRYSDSQKGRILKKRKVV
ncbi:DNA polymerase-3 subunit alpha [Lutibacter sp. Hel_I_33_5]|uniref:DNA polymerase III subunit alpha n=1 Tax=Lutibacter sp. Hel_I_33_5 TaxID=1566289 RepID=UPI0011A2990F|nr:DNA polymerase III subunit alpha [Lutibacter sp. Hel_I_33_5]TVZ56930.1 DNA polymerase-3 subunit alpha [Lutibacter sp. Hel_I_33_5]